MSQLNYHHLRYFHAIVREGTLTRAAESLHVSQSALSIQLKKLEESLDCALFDRQHKTLILTEEGKMVLDYAETIPRLKSLSWNPPATFSVASAAASRASAASAS